MSQKKRANQVVYLSEVNLTILEVVTRMTGSLKSDVLRYVLTKSFSNPAWAENEFDCPGLANEIKEALANSQQ